MTWDIWALGKAKESDIVDFFQPTITHRHSVHVLNRIVWHLKDLGVTSAFGASWKVVTQTFICSV